MRKILRAFTHSHRYLWWFGRRWQGWWCRGSNTRCQPLGNRSSHGNRKRMLNFLKEATEARRPHRYWLQKRPISPTEQEAPRDHMNIIEPCRIQFSNNIERLPHLHCKLVELKADVLESRETLEVRSPYHLKEGISWSLQDNPQRDWGTFNYTWIESWKMSWKVVRDLIQTHEWNLLRDVNLEGTKELIPTGG